MIDSNKPIVSVVIATYNREKSIGKAIKSAIDQSYRNIEVIVSDDGSTDQTKKVVQTYLKNPKVRYIYQENKKCHVYPMNNGIKVAKGKYIAILDDDDFWCDKNKIEKQVNFLEKNKDHVLVGGGAIKVDENGKEIINYLLPENDADIRENILVRNLFVHVSVLFTKDAWEKAGTYDENFDGMEDWDLWMRMGRIGKFHNIPEFFVIYSGHQYNNPSYVERKYSRWEWLKLNIKLKKRHNKNYPHYKKALLFCWLGYFYSLLPFRRKLWPIVFKLRCFLSGVLKYQRKHNN